MYEMEGPRRGHLAGYRLLGYRGAIRPLHRGGEISSEGQFPGFPCTPLQTFRFPGPTEYGGPADLHTWWWRISTAYLWAAQGFSVTKLPISWL
jgi:hypothetical protein